MCETVSRVSTVGRGARCLATRRDGEQRAMLRRVCWRARGEDTAMRQLGLT